MKIIRARFRKSRRMKRMSRSKRSINTGRETERIKNGREGERERGWGHGEEAGDIVNEKDDESEQEVKQDGY